MNERRTSDAKRELRRRLLAERARLAPDDRAARSRAIAAALASLDAFRGARAVGLYAALGAEVDTAEIAARALAAGKRLAWPRLDAGGLRMRFAACAPDALVAGPLGAREPPPDAPEVPGEDLDLVVVPGVAFDARGRRLGRGRGHYDATLAALPARTARVGIGFDLQLVEEVPEEAHDAALDAVVTERRVVGARVAAAPPGGQTSR